MMYLGYVIIGLSNFNLGCSFFCLPNLNIFLGYVNHGQKKFVTIILEGTL
jgi:hypothetical protein